MRPLGPAAAGAGHPPGGALPDRDSAPGRAAPPSGTSATHRTGLGCLGAGTATPSPPAVRAGLRGDPDGGTSRVGPVAAQGRPSAVRPLGVAGDGVTGPAWRG